MESLYFQTAESLTAWLKENGEKPFRAGQILSWLFKRGVTSFDKFTNLPSPLIEKLKNAFTLRTADLQRVEQSAWAIKTLLKLHDAETVECVMLTDDRGHHTVCLSTQVGCAMGCRFCATGQTQSRGKCFVRNLESDEIVQQVLFFQDFLAPEERIGNIVVMGMGEPMLNLDNTLQALEVISEKLEIGARKITISTVGIVEGIERIADSGKQYHLAVSLHAPNDELRNRIVPANKNVGIEAILKAADDFFEKTGRRITYEYVLLGKTNDSPHEAEELAQLLHGRNALVNVIPYNEVEGLPFKRPYPKDIENFTKILESHSIQVQVRKEKGGKIDAACGQLRRINLSEFE